MQSNLPSLSSMVACTAPLHQKFSTLVEDFYFAVHAAAMEVNYIIFFNIYISFELSSLVDLRRAAIITLSLDSNLRDTRRFENRTADLCRSTKLDSKLL